MVIVLLEIWDNMADEVLTLHSKWGPNGIGKCMGKGYFRQINA